MITNYISNACGYKIPRLKDVVYLVDKSTSKVINIDSGEASATITNTSPTRLEGFGIRLTEEESLDERYLFVKTVNVSINGHFSIINDDYLVVVEDYEGNYYLVNVDFPSKTTYTYTLSEGKDQTDLTFTSNSNYPLLKLTWNVVNTTNCKVYSYGGIKNLKLIEKGWARVDAENNSITLYDSHTFKDVDFNDASCVLTETYDGNNITNSITFDIPLDKAQSSWQYNLIEFKQNVYIAEILPKNSDHALMAGFENGLQPSYNVQGSTSNGDTSKITITLTETSHRGLEELVNWSVNQDTNKKWVYIKQIDHRNAYTCISHGVGRYDYMAEVDQDGNVLGNYKIYSGANRNKFPLINIVGYFHDVVTFSSTICSCSDDYMYEFNNHYYCVNGDKVQALESIHTYDCGRSGEINGTGSPISDYTKLGALVEPHSNFCDTNVEYMWVLKTDKFECVSLENRWVESGYTCSGESGYDKYLVEKEQIWDSNQGWVDTNPLITRITLIEADSSDCGYVAPKAVLRLYSGSHTVPCSADSLKRSEVSAYTSSIIKAEIKECTTSIAHHTFTGATSMVEVDFPNTLETIGSNVFDGCYSISGDVVLPNSLQGIGDYAFRGCSNVSTFTIGEGCYDIGTYAFSNCTGLRSITINRTQPPTAHGSHIFDNTNDCPIYVPCGSVLSYRNAMKWGQYADRILPIPQSCDLPVEDSDKITLHLKSLTIVGYVCDSTSAITSGDVSSRYSGDVISAAIGYCVNTIGDNAFRDCSLLSDVAMPDNITNINSSAFQDCIRLVSLNIPASVTVIGYSAFTGCLSLTGITVNATTPPTLGSSAFNNTNNCPIYVPAGSVNTYKAATNWVEYASRIQPIPT